MEFKGTKGKWEVNKHLCIVDENGYGIAQVHGIANDKDWESNALLISKAPEMLEMLKMNTDALDLSNLEFYNKYGFNVAEVIPRTHELIKQATEIN